MSLACIIGRTSMGTKEENEINENIMTKKKSERVRSVEKKKDAE